jgi:electron transport complex protein RnfC
MTLTSPTSADGVGSSSFREIGFPSDREPGNAEAGTSLGMAHQLPNKVESSSATSTLNRLIDAGITADRWTCPDLIGQFRQASQRPPKIVVCGAIDLDSALPLQRTLCSENAIEIAAGAAAMGKILGAQRIFLAVPEDMTSAGVAGLRSAAEATYVRLFPLLEQYPLAHPSLLIRRITGRKVSPGKLPTEAGVLMLDAPAAIAIARYLIHGQMMRQVPMGIYDQSQNRAHLLRVPVGSKLGDILSTTGVSEESTELWAGHVLRHVPMNREAVVGSGDLTFFASAPRRTEAAAACLRCGWCVEACPVRIQPAGLLDAAQQNDPQLAEQYGLHACIDCGICSYVCPSRLPLLKSIREMRK